MAEHGDMKEAIEGSHGSPAPSTEHGPAVLVNASGHVQALDRK